MRPTLPEQEEPSGRGTAGYPHHCTGDGTSRRGPPHCRFDWRRILWEENLVGGRSAGLGVAMWEFLAGNVALGLVLCLTVAALVWWQRRALQEMVGVPETTWRVIAWGAFGLTV